METDFIIFSYCTKLYQNIFENSLDIIIYIRTRVLLKIASEKFDMGCDLLKGWLVGWLVLRHVNPC